MNKAAKKAVIGSTVVLAAGGIIWAWSSAFGERVRLSKDPGYLCIEAWREHFKDPESVEYLRTLEVDKKRFYLIAEARATNGFGTYVKETVACQYYPPNTVATDPFGLTQDAQQDAARERMERSRTQ